MKNCGKVITMMLLTALMLAGCGKAENSGEKAPAETTNEAAETSAEQTEDAGEAAETSAAQTEDAGETTDFVYLQEYQIKDVNGDGKEYTLYAPKGGKVMEEWYYTFYEYGIDFSALVYNGGTMDKLQEYMEQLVDRQMQEWQEDSDYSDAAAGKMQEKGDDRYLILRVKETDSQGTPYQKISILYMNVREGGVGVCWSMEVCEDLLYEETPALIEEVARCYDIDLGEVVMEVDTWADQDAQRKEQEKQEGEQWIADQQDIYEPREGDPVLEKVDGYRYLGSMTLIFDEENDITCPVLVPMGAYTGTWENAAQAMMHGVRVIAGISPRRMDLQEVAQEEADEELERCSDPEKGNRNVQISKVMPMQGQESGVFYVLEYEEPGFSKEEYHSCTEITFMVPVQDEYYLHYEIRLNDEGYDVSTNILIKELETAYGLDLSAWYAEEEALQTKE